MNTPAHRHSDDALVWLVRLCAQPRSEQTEREFALWLSASASHKQQFDAALALWDDLESVRLLPFGDNSTTDKPASFASSFWLRGVAAIAATVLIAVLSWQQLTPEVIEPQRFSTAQGELNDITLSDGSELALNTSTAIEVRYNDDQRHIHLNRGEAYFKVAHSPERPFVVHLGSVSVTALGTAFNIHRRSQDSLISVTHGTVLVKNKQDSMRLTAGETLAANDTNLRESDSDTLEHITAWQRGEILADKLPLRELVKEFNRYTDLHIIMDHELANLPVSGVFRTDQVESVLKALETTHQLQVDKIDNNTLRLLNTAR